MKEISLRHALLRQRSVVEPRSDAVILFVHGAWLGSWIYANYVGYFARQGVPCATIDLRGHGGLEQNALFMRSGQSEMAQDVVEACAAIGGDVILAGHSAGAAIAALAASRYPSSGLILLAPSPPGQLPGLAALPAEPENALVLPGTVDRIQEKFVPNLDRGAAEAFAMRLVGESPVLLNDRRLLRVSVDRERISGPALCLAAEKEMPSFHDKGQDYRTACFYDAEYWFLAGAGHCFMWEPGWEKSAKIIMSWYRRNFAY